MKLAITSGLIIGMALALLYNFIMIAVYGEVVIKEPNTAWLAIEIALLIGIFCFGLYLFGKALGIKYWLNRLDYWLGSKLPSVEQIKKWGE